MVRFDSSIRATIGGCRARFEVARPFVVRYPLRQAGGRDILELWVPAEELDEFNQHIVGLIEVVHEFRADPVDQPEPGRRRG